MTPADWGLAVLWMGVGLVVATLLVGMGATVPHIAFVGWVACSVGFIVAVRWGLK